MESFSVYEHTSTKSFRIVAGDHVPHTGSETYTVRVYQGTTMADAAHAAFSAETRGDIRAQIARFFNVENPAHRRLPQFAEDLAPNPDIHEFESTKVAFILGAELDRSPTLDDTVKHGDMLIIEPEKIIGIACARPFAITAVSGELDQLIGNIMDALDGRGITPVYLRPAVNEAIRRGYLLASWAYAFAGV